MLCKKCAKYTSNEKFYKATTAQNKVLKHASIACFCFCFTDVRSFCGIPLNWKFWWMYYPWDAATWMWSSYIHFSTYSYLDMDIKGRREGLKQLTSNWVWMSPLNCLLVVALQPWDSWTLSLKRVMKFFLKSRAKQKNKTPPFEI